MRFYGIFNRLGDLVCLRLFQLAESAVIYRDAYHPDCCVKCVLVKEDSENES